MHHKIKTRFTLYPFMEILNEEYLIFFFQWQLWTWFWYKKLKFSLKSIKTGVSLRLAFAYFRKLDKNLTVSLPFGVVQKINLYKSKIKLNFMLSVGLSKLFTSLQQIMKIGKIFIRFHLCSCFLSTMLNRIF